MLRLGVVENLSYDGTLILRSDHAPPNGAAVVDKGGAAIGSVSKVFGPVKRPYVAVRPAGTPTLGLVGKELYLSQGKPHGHTKERRGSRRDH